MEYLNISNQPYTMPAAQAEPFNKATHPADKPMIAKHIFAVDSRQRDFKYYPNSNNYNISIPDKYKNVTSIELKAAMLPRTEYNINSCNKYLDISIGDYISNIYTKGIVKITEAGKAYGEATNVNLNISSPIFPGGVQAEIKVDLDKDSKIINYNIINAGSGYSSTDLPKISLGDFDKFEIIVGTNYIIKLREGQYTIGGNPQFTDNSTPISVLQSWVPSNLLCEMENAISGAILGESHTDYCYSRRSWSGQSGAPTSSTSDYPLLFTTRLMSQYPSVETYEVGSIRNNNNNYETNSCKFNRIYTTNCLIFRVDNLPPTIFVDDEGFEYTILKYEIIPMGFTSEYIIYCKLNNPFHIGLISSKYWEGMSIVAGYTIELAHWEFLFATGNNNCINSSSLLGYNKNNYNLSVNNNVIEVSHVSGGPPNVTTLIPKGLTYSSENDYNLIGDPEYITLSFRPKFGGNTISGINDRVDSQPESNINRVFACLIYDSIHPSVLQDVSSGQLDATIGSLGYSNNNLNSFMNTDNSYSDVKQLTGNSGDQNVSYSRAPGLLRPMAGSDFDRKIIEFPQPICQIFSMNIRFTKFAQSFSQGTNVELYDFHGREHLLLFEITCSDLMTGKTF